ncbi:MAG: hypothetical protein ACK55Z_07630, partial [bacterium]
SNISAGGFYIRVNLPTLSCCLSACLSGPQERCFICPLPAVITSKLTRRQERGIRRGGRDWGFCFSLT